MTDLIKKPSIEDIFRIKVSFLSRLNELHNLDRQMAMDLELICAYTPYRIDYRFDCQGEDRETKTIDQQCWSYLIKVNQLEKYMLHTEYHKLQEQIKRFDFPEFTLENARGWLENLKSLVQDNVKSLVKKVYADLTNQGYHTGSGYRGMVKKKRNNCGIDSHFILSTGDNYRLRWYSSTPTITDDLEKVCYLLNGEPVPEKTLIMMAKSDQEGKAQCDYLRIKVCANGNTHFWIEEKTRDLLNSYGPEGFIIGEKIRIKIFDKAAS